MSVRSMESFRYAFRRELLPLYAAVGIGWAVMNATPLPVALPGFANSIVSLLVSVAGLAMFLGGVVGVVHRIVEDGA